MLTFGSLFAGVGGMDLGLEMAGLECVWQVENNPYCRRVLNRHWPLIPKAGDVHEFPGDKDWTCPDIIVGGDPCQRNSGAGPGHGESLASEFLRVVDEFRPAGVLRENPTHVRKDAPWPWWRFRAGLESRGYAVLPFRLRACCIGALHQRDRLFVFGIRADANCDRLERRQAMPAERRDAQFKGLVPTTAGMDIFNAPGLGSRAGLPCYVEQIRGLGNAIHVGQGYQIGKWLIESQKVSSAT